MLHQHCLRNWLRNRDNCPFHQDRAWNMLESNMPTLRPRGNDNDRIHVSVSREISHSPNHQQKVQIRSAIMRIIKRYGTSPPLKVSVWSMPSSQIIHVLLTFLRTTLLGTVSNRQTRATTLASPHASGILPSSCARTAFLLTHR